MFTYSLRVTVARVALVAMLFSAASPTFAAGIFHDRADVLVRLLGVYPLRGSEPVYEDGFSRREAPVHDHDAAHHHGNHVDEGSTENSSDDGHAAHGVFCSFCLTSSSVTALVRSDAAGASLTTNASVFAAAVEELYVRLLPCVYDARGPPALSAL